MFGMQRSNLSGFGKRQPISTRASDTVGRDIFKNDEDGEEINDISRIVQEQDTSNIEDTSF